MPSLHYLGHLLAFFYTVLGGGILWRGSKPNCRICLYRGCCLNRVRRFVVPECAKEKPGGQSPEIPAVSE